MSQLNRDIVESPLYLDPQKYEVSHLMLVKNNKTSDLSILKSFKTHSLAQQNTAALMNRMDSKYLLPISHFDSFMQSIETDYTILSAFDKRAFNYQTTYFDNQQRQFYLDHHNGKLNRYKVRFRRYVESDKGFMEVKFKNNQRRTIKQRIPMDCILPNQLKVNSFVQQLLGYSVQLEPVLFVNYQRITLLNKNYPERITIDLNLSFRSALSQVQSIQDKTFIVEIKQDRKQIQSSCRDFLKKNGQRDINFSKYCIGSILTNSINSSEPIKFNRFKPVLRHLEKFNNRR
jgi:hypothetical protein